MEGTNERREADELRAYRDTGYTPGQVRDMAFLYREKCRQVSELRRRMREMEREESDGKDE